MRREKLRRLVEDVLDARASAVQDRPVALRMVSVDFDRRMVAVDGRVYGPIDAAGFTFPLLDSVHPVMPTRTSEPW